MIKASIPGGTPLLILGLSRQETEMLLAGRSISVELMGPFGKEGIVLLVAGETEESIQNALAPSLPAGTRVERSGP